MSVSAFNSNLAGINRPLIRTQDSPPPKISISQTLQRFLADTISGKTHWNRQSQKENGRYKDQFTASNAGINLQLKASHPVSRGAGAPTLLMDWEAQLSTAGKSPRILDGKSLILPDKVNDSTPLTVQTLSKLFKKAYDSVSSAFEGFAPMVNRLTEKLTMQDPSIETSYSFIKPSLMYPSFGSGSVMQITDKAQNIKVEVTRFGGESQVTIRHGDEKATKLKKSALENPVLFQAVDNLVKAANFERTNNPNLGIQD